MSLSAFFLTDSRNPSQTRLGQKMTVSRLSSPQDRNPARPQKSLEAGTPTLSGLILSLSLSVLLLFKNRLTSSPLLQTRFWIS